MRLSAQIVLVLAVIVIATALALALGAANLGTALGIGQIFFTVAVIVLLMRA